MVGLEQWQRMIDWMALKGIIHPLPSPAGTVWRLVLQDSASRTTRSAAFLVAPAYLPWGWMGNIDGLGGPLPDSWIDSHTRLRQSLTAGAGARFGI